MNKNNCDAFRAAMSIGARDLSAEALVKCAEAGIRTVELSYGEMSMCADIPWSIFRKTADKHQIELWSFHLPFGPFEQVDISSDDPDLRDRSVAYLSELVKAAGDNGILTAVIHPSGEPLKEEKRSEHIKYAQDSLAHLADIAERSGIVIAVENLPRTCLGRDSSDMLALLSVDERLMSCFDTNHLLKQPATEYIAAVGYKIRTTHVSDYDYKNERHWLPGEGLTDWPKLINALQSSGYHGPILYELGLRAPATIERRDLTYADFKANHDALIHLKQPQPIGKPIPEACKDWRTL